MRHDPDESAYVDVDSGEARSMGRGEKKRGGDGEVVKDDSRGDMEEEEEDEGVGLVLFGVPCVTGDESHYITTHEIQLSELSDHEGDSDDVGVGWEDSQVYSFVDYDAFEESGNKEKPSSPHVSSAQPHQQQQQQIHLSIRTTSRTGGDNLVYHGDVSGYLFRGVDGDAAKCFIAAPGRVHFGARLRGKEVTDSSGTSSAVSELDDADKEVRSLTAKAFKSLAYPYFDTINFSTSSESSASEKWSAFVDLQYGNVDKRVVSRQSLENRSFAGFTINGNPQAQLGFMGKLGQGHSGVIRLTETLNFRCNVGVAGAERPPMFAQSAAAVGSRSRDEVTNAVAEGAQWRLGATTKPPCQKTMEHKKAVFASSLIKNVISKKMQFEQERKMERGEISESNAQEDSGKASRGGRELVRQSSKFSESSSDLAIMCVDELGDLVDSGSCDTKSDRTHRQEALALETNLEQANEAGIDTKKGAMEASKSTLLRSQNSAFRCWKDEELEFQKDRKSAPGSAHEANDNDLAQSDVKRTKMSSLFVPSIKRLSGDEQQQNSPSIGGKGDVKARSDNALFVTDSRRQTAKSPEIKINLRSGKNEPFGVTRLRAPNIGCGRTEDYKSLALAAVLRGECSDKVPHFMVRDIRDNKGKLQTPIHQVRDVRKLVKSSYHFVSLDNSENKTTLATSDSHTETRKQAPGRNSSSGSPIVIKCQSVNTNNNEKPVENVADLCNTEDFERSSPDGAKGSLSRASERASSSDGGFITESRVAAWKQEKDNVDQKTDKVTSQVAYEKLQAAVKTMEQLYVFDKNEWKRKNKPNPLTDSHMLPLITTEEQDRVLAPAKDSSSEKVESRGRYEEQVGHSSSYEDRFIMRSMWAENQATKSPYGTKAFTPKSPKLPKSTQRPPQRRLSGQDRAESKEDQAISDHENYLTIPVKPASKQAPPPDANSVYTFKSRTPPGPARTAVQDNPPASIVMETPETPSAAIYHSLPMGIPTNQMYCFSPAVTPAPSLDPFQHTQRKMLLDPTTGNYYLVDTPVQPTSKRLFDPETGQYVDVPLPQPPMTPVPMALSPGAYAHTYMIYPGFMPPTVIPARTLVPSQMSVLSDPADKAPFQQSEAPYMESPYYMATGRSPQAARPSASRTPQGYSAVKQPFISITSPQQGPRIIAPPSFDGTTMSFVVEHR